MPYVGEVPKSFRCFTAPPQEGDKGHRADDRVRHSPAFHPQPWQPFALARPTLGAQVWQAKMARVWLTLAGTAGTGTSWLIVARHARTAEQKFFTSAGSSLGLRVGLTRWNGEQGWPLRSRSRNGALPPPLTFLAGGVQWPNAANEWLEPSMNADTFLQCILDDPAGAATMWPILADWLEDQGDARAELVRLCHDPRYRPSLAGLERDARVRDLLAAGLSPCVPAWDNSLGMKLALIPAGKFLMGSPAKEAERSADEGPQHEVEITKPFYLGIHPVTVGTFRTFVQRSGYKTEAEKSGGTYRWAGGRWELDPNTNWLKPGFKQSKDHPVNCVSWNDAQTFCKWLGEIEKERAYRLPTEAEWEYACRGGAPSSTPSHFGDSLSSAQANFDGKCPYGGASKGQHLKRTTAGGSYKANAFGLFDMHGNVWEWCADLYGAYTRQSLKDPPGPATGQLRILRGGSWGVNGRYCRSACRFSNFPGNRGINFGFRVVCSART